MPLLRPAHDVRELSGRVECTCRDSAYAITSFQYRITGTNVQKIQGEIVGRLTRNVTGTPVLSKE